MEDVVRSSTLEMVIMIIIIRVTDMHGATVFHPDHETNVRPGRPRKHEGAQRREQLLDHAVRLFGQHGFGGLRLETIAREARVSLSTIYAQYGGKAGLFSAAVRRYSDEFVATLPLEPSGQRPVEAVLVEFAEAFLFSLTRPELVQLRAQIFAEAGRFPELAEEFYTQGPQRTLEGLAQYFRQCQRMNLLAPGDSEFLAGQFLNALRGERFQRLQLGLEPTPSGRAIGEWARAVVKLFLHGCIPGSSA